jgi:hypothetical protein
MATKKDTPVSDETNLETSTPMDTKPTTTGTAKQPEGVGFAMYIGPTIKGVILHGTLYRGTKDDAVKAAAGAVEKQPLVKKLIVSGEELPAARLKIKTPGNSLYETYRKVAKAK